MISSNTVTGNLYIGMAMVLDMSDEIWILKKSVLKKKGGRGRLAIAVLSFTAFTSTSFVSRVFQCVCLCA